MSRAELSPEEMMDVAKQLAKGDPQDQNYGDGSGSGSGSDSYGQGVSAGQNQYSEDPQQQSSDSGEPQQQAFQQQAFQQQAFQQQAEPQGRGSTQPGTNGPNDSTAFDNLPTNNRNNQFSSHSVPQDTQQGLQASGQGFGQGFDQGFGQGLAGGPDGSAPHPGVEVTEQSGPGFASRDADLHRTGSARGGGYETHQHHRDTFETKSVIQG